VNWINVAQDTANWRSF